MTRHPGFLLVAGWALLNGLLLAVLAIYGESATALACYGIAVGLLALAALAVLASSVRGPREHTRYRLPVRPGSAVLPLAAAAGLAVLAYPYGWWLLPIAAALLGLSLALAAHDRAARPRRSR
ncbi:hypothetical protein [Streptomyces hoynatensis]|uniref:Uncharacterized protein n=1 Tax=Streptomyces hoynatensis TaxID=1141874 RepID=A0A3A9YSJ4_9ACTN|nr:hypothetical protein [Streptomyces hoynatensis]RKN39008.1 hypothetical protein D7294_22770 [Streptomyces hoynatensis]